MLRERERDHDVGITEGYFTFILATSSNDPGEPTISYIWTGWVWEIIGWNSIYTSQVSHITSEDFMN